MLLSRAAVIWQSDGFAKLQRLCHTLIFLPSFFYTPLFVSYLVLFLGYISCFSHFSLVVSTRNSIFAEKMCFKQHINLMNKHILYTQVS